MKTQNAAMHYTHVKPYPFVSSLIFLALVLGVIFYDSLIYMVDGWSSEEYSHGYLIPVIAGWLIWQKRGQISPDYGKATWFGVVVTLFGLLLYLVGELSTLYIIVQYAFLVTLAGVSLAYFGWSGMRHLWAPLAYLVFMIPLPGFLYGGLSAELQLISSSVGVAFIRLFDILVYLQGNVIDLGGYKLQVVEACSGLRYLFPLMSFGFLCAYLYKGALWERAVLFLSTIPITILMNSFRIGVIGILVEYRGIEMAEGFLHDFEGWAIFMACVAILFAEMWLLIRLGPDKRTFNQVFGVQNSVLNPPARQPLPLTRPYIATLCLLLLTAVGGQFLSQRTEVALERQRFASFPLEIKGWNGQETGMEKIYLDELDLDDYIVANYHREKETNPVNFYAAYYSSQRKGASIHSPKTCLPGGGWRIAEFYQRVIDVIPTADGTPLQVNRAIIRYGEQSTLVYYWFQQRHRHLTNEYLVKWFLFWDSLTRNRTDGALIRLTTPMSATSDPSEADQRLTDLLAALFPQLSNYIPD